MNNIIDAEHRFENIEALEFLFDDSNAGMYQAENVKLLKTHYDSLISATGNIYLGKKGIFSDGFSAIQSEINHDPFTLENIYSDYNNKLKKEAEKAGFRTVATYNYMINDSNKLAVGKDFFRCHSKDIPVFWIHKDVLHDYMQQDNLLDDHPIVLDVGSIYLDSIYVDDDIIYLPTNESYCPDDANILIVDKNNKVIDADTFNEISYQALEIFYRLYEITDIKKIRQALDSDKNEDILYAFNALDRINDDIDALIKDLG